MDAPCQVDADERRQRKAQSTSEEVEEAAESEDYEKLKIW